MGPQSCSARSNGGRAGLVDQTDRIDKRRCRVVGLRGMTRPVLGGKAHPGGHRDRTPLFTPAHRPRGGVVRRCCAEARARIAASGAHTSPGVDPLLAGLLEVDAEPRSFSTSMGRSASRVERRPAGGDTLPRLQPRPLHHGEGRPRHRLTGGSSTSATGVSSRRTSAPRWPPSSTASPASTPPATGATARRRPATGSASPWGAALLRRRSRERADGFCNQHGKSYLTRRRGGEEGGGGGSVTGGTIPSA